MKNLTIPLLVLLVSGGLWAQNPEQAVNEYFDYFNNSDKDALNNASDSPFVFLIGNNKTVAEKYGDSVNFEGLRKEGWAYSKINDSELIYSDELSAMVEINFSRFNAKDEALSTTDAIYLLVYKNDNWLLKAGFIGSSLSLGQGKKVLKMKSKNVVQFTGDLEDAAYRKLTKQELVKIIKKKGWDTDENQLLKKEKEILIHLAKTLHLQK